MTPNKRKFNINYQAKFTSTEKDNDLRVWVAKPNNSIYQKIGTFNISSRPTSSYYDQQGNKILYFHFSKIKDVNLSIDIKATLSTDPRDISIIIPQQKLSGKNQFTKSDKFLEQTKSIKYLVYKLTNKEPDLEAKIKIIFNFVAKEFKYCYPVKKRGVKNLNLNKLQGDCGEYSSLLVTMLRILGVSTVNQTGFVIFPKEKSITEHGWAGVFIKNRWIDIDPQYASLENRQTSAYKKYFLKRSEYRLVFTTGFNIPIKPRIPSKYDRNFWNNNGLPLSCSSTQTLQPLIFASKYKIKFDDKIDLK